MASTPIRITISQAATLFGISEKTIRRAVQTGELHYVVVRDSYKINFDSLLEWSQTHVKIKNKFNQHGIGQFVNQWKIKNTLFSPNPKLAEHLEKKKEKKPKKSKKTPTNETDKK